MTGNQILSTMQQVPLFKNLNETECRQLAEIAQEKQFAPGEVIIRQEQYSQELWVVLEGQCEVIKFTGEQKPSREALVLAVLEPYNHFGEMSFFHSAPHSASIRAKTEVKLLKIIRGDYEELIQDGCRAAYKLAYNTVECLADRLRKMDEWVADLMARAGSTGSLASTPMKTPDGKVQEWSEFREKMLTSWSM